MIASPPIPPSTPIDLLAAFFNTSEPCKCFDDPTIEQIALLLARLGHVAQREPRTYIVLRLIGRLDVLEQLLTAGFGDGWFPVEARSLPGFLDPSTRADILNNQRLILTKATNLENGRHCHFGPEETLPFTTLSRLGSGSFGQVTRIESTVTFRQYALKTIRRRAAFGEQSKRTMKDILSEMRIMQSLQHEHIVRYIGSYTNKNSFGILMSPIAEKDLAVYLQQAMPTMHPTLRTFFGCLARALSFLHENTIRHRDIKPQNILIHGSKVLLTDFGLSRDYVDTTSGPTQASPRYRAPEVAAGEGRNTSADIWALGCVFLEMLATLRGCNVDWLRKYYLTNGDGITTNFHANLYTTEKLLNEWETELEATDTPAIAWTKRMLEPRRNDRPSAAEMANEITASNDRVSFMYSCSLCCESETDSDSILSLLDDLHDTPARKPSKPAKIPRKPLPQHVVGSADNSSLRVQTNSLDETTERSLETASSSDASFIKRPTSSALSQNIVSERASAETEPSDDTLPYYQSLSVGPSNTEPSRFEPLEADLSLASARAQGLRRTRNSDTADSGYKYHQTELSCIESQSSGPPNPVSQSTELQDAASNVTESFRVERSNAESSTTELSYVDTLSTEPSTTRSSTPRSLSIESLPKVQTEPLQTDTASLHIEFPQFESLQLESLQLGPRHRPTLPTSIPVVSLNASSARADERTAEQNGDHKPERMEFKALPRDSSAFKDDHTDDHERDQLEHTVLPPELDSFKEIAPVQKRSSRTTLTAEFDISHIPFYIDDKLICIPGKVPMVFGRCIEFILQAENRDFTDCLDFQKHKVTPYAMQHLLAAFDRSSIQGWQYDFSDCEASDVARYLQIYLNSLPSPLLPITLNTALPLPDLKEITKCLLALKQDRPVNYTMGLCLLAFLATYVDLGKRHDPTQLWVSTAAGPYSLPKVIFPAPALPTLCFLVANARQFLKSESKNMSSQSRWQPTTSRASSRLDSTSQIVQGQNGKPQNADPPGISDDTKRNKLRKRESSLSIFRQLSGEGWRGWRKKSDS